MAGLPPQLLRRARQSHGVLTRAELLDAGLSERAVTSLLGSGALHSLHRRTVVLVSGFPMSWEARAVAALRLCDASVLLCRSSAGRVLGFSLRAGDDDPVELLAGRGSPRRRLDGVVWRTTRRLDAPERVAVGPFRNTSAARTLVDLALTLDAATLQRLVDDTLGRRLVSADRVARTLERMGSRGRAGAEQLERLLQPWAGADIESPAEGDVLRWLQLRGFPRPVCQFEVRSRSPAIVARLDFAWPAAAVALEMDGYAWHASPGRFVADRERTNLLISLGWTVLRTTPRALAEGAPALEQALRHLLSSPTRRATSPKWQ